MKNSAFSRNAQRHGIERAENLVSRTVTRCRWRYNRRRHDESPDVTQTKSHQNTIAVVGASLGAPRKVVRLAQVPYYARPRLTPFLSARVSPGSGSIRRALADAVPFAGALCQLGIKLVNGRKKWSRDNAGSFPRPGVHSLPLPVCEPQSPPSTPRSPRLAPFPCRRHIRLPGISISMKRAS